MNEGNQEREGVRYEAMKERNKDWISKASSPRLRRDDRYPEGLPFVAFDSSDDVESIEKRVIKKTREQWKGESPSELESALHRFERRRKAAGERAKERYENRMFESDIEHARTELRNWFAWNWKMRAVKELLFFKDLEGPQATPVDPLDRDALGDTTSEFLEDVARLWRGENHPMPSTQMEVARAVVKRRKEEGRQVLPWTRVEDGEIDAPAKSLTESLRGDLGKQGRELRGTSNAEKARMLVYIARATFPTE